MKHVTMILVGVCFFALSSMAQIKKQSIEQKADHTTTTLVIKDSEDIDDMELLNDSFQLEDYDVGDVIIIATDEGNNQAELPAANKKVTRNEELAVKAPKMRKSKRKIGKGLAKNKYAKRNKRPKRKSDIAYNSNVKKGKKAKWDKRCYSW